MKNIRWQIALGAMLISLSALFYFIHYQLFHDIHHVFIYLIGDIAFVPLEILLATVIIDRLIEKNERKHTQKRIHMIIGAFFSSLGNQLLKNLSGLDIASIRLEQELELSQQWTPQKFKDAKHYIEQHQSETNPSPKDLVQLGKLLTDKKDFLLALLENPSLIEHGHFTSLLWKLLHCAEELGAREDLHQIEKSDLDHLTIDFNRAYSALLIEWISHMEHLSKDYPYLFSFAVRTNPFNPKAKITV